MLILDVTVINVALPTLSSEMGLNPALAGWAITAYAIPFAALLLMGGKAADNFGSRNTLLAGLAMFTAASLAAGLSADITTLLLARAAQGVGAALMSPSALAAVMQKFSGADRGRALAVWGAIGAVGAAFGVLIGGVLTDGPGWRWIFFINVPIGILVAGLLPFVVSATSTIRSRSLDIPGVVIIAAAMGFLVYGISMAGDAKSPQDWIAPIVGAAGLMWLFIFVERRTPEPLVDLDVFKRRTLQAGSLVMLAASGLLVGIFFVLSFLLQKSFEWSPLSTGLAFLPIAVSTLIGAHFAGHFLSRTGARPFASAGFGVAAAGFVLAATQIHVASMLIIASSVVALGLGAAFVSATTTALSNVSHEEAGILSGVVNIFHELGGAVGVTALSAIATAGIMSGDAPRGFESSLTVAAIAAAVVGIAALILVPKGKPSAGAPRFVH
ncbi:MFS transporter [Arthrobacter sp. RHLT1-20]